MCCAPAFPGYPGYPVWYPDRSTRVPGYGHPGTRRGTGYPGRFSTPGSQEQLVSTFKQVRKCFEKFDVAVQPPSDPEGQA
eukprot:3430790-Rhodomonas_salina.1